MTLNEYLYHDNASMSKVTGVLHLVHTWPEQGRKAEKVHQQSVVIAASNQISPQYGSIHLETCCLHVMAPNMCSRQVNGRWSTQDPFWAGQ
jgi:hypothetical protein